MLDVDHVGQVALGEPHDAERARFRGVDTGGERDDLDGHVRAVGHLQEVLQLAAHDAGPPGRAAQHRLVQHGPQVHRLRLAQQGLAGHPQPDPLIDLGGRGLLASQVRDRARVVLGLQQPGHELELVGPDAGRGLLEADVGLEPGRQHVAVVVPPPVPARGAGQFMQGRALLLVGHLVEGEQVGDVALLEAHPAGLQPAHLRPRGPDHAPRVLQGDAPLLAQPP